MYQGDFSKDWYERNDGIDGFHCATYIRSAPGLMFCHVRASPYCVLPALVRLEIAWIEDAQKYGY